jgi:CDGSH-type Zn-finger protein
MEKKVKVTKDGPYIVYGELPLSREIAIPDKEGTPEIWKQSKKISTERVYHLCRCGSSTNKPFCDGSHHEAHFNGTETADNKKFLEKAETINGPELVLKDVPEFCVGAKFCDRLSGVWDLTRRSDDPKCKKAATQEACNCPSGRLVVCDKKTGKAIELDFKPSISITEDKESGISGPI